MTTYWSGTYHNRSDQLSKEWSVQKSIVRVKTNQMEWSQYFRMRQPRCLRVASCIVLSDLLRLKTLLEHVHDCGYGAIAVYLWGDELCCNFDKLSPVITEVVLDIIRLSEKVEVPVCFNLAPSSYSRFGSSVLAKTEKLMDELLEANKTRHGIVVVRPHPLFVGRHLVSTPNVTVDILDTNKWD